LNFRRYKEERGNNEERIRANTCFIRLLSVCPTNEKSRGELTVKEKGAEIGNLNGLNQKSLRDRGGKDLKTLEEAGRKKSRKGPARGRGCQRKTGVEHLRGVHARVTEKRGGGGPKKNHQPFSKGGAWKKVVWKKEDFIRKNRRPTRGNAIAASGEKTYVYTPWSNGESCTAYGLRGGIGERWHLRGISGPLP